MNETMVVKNKMVSYYHLPPDDCITDGLVQPSSYLSSPFSAPHEVPNRIPFTGFACIE
jgi:hypothetical protein